jgi:signal transduction histidine kinase
VPSLSGRKTTARSTLLRPFRVSAILAILALVISLGFLALSAWRSDQRLSPLESHIAYLQGIAQTSSDIQQLLARHAEDNTNPQKDEIAKITSDITALQEQGGQLAPETPTAMRKAMEYITDPPGNIRIGLLNALSLIRHVQQMENARQQSTITHIRRAANSELIVASVALVIIPGISILLLIWLNRRSFGAIHRLSELLDNVGNLEFDRFEPAHADDPLAEVYDRYNTMTARLRDASQRVREHTSNLENQVRAASETLVRQQADLESGARLAAIGEFSARLAHELRNPLSGISMAVRNMEHEVEDPDHRERLSMVAEEMDRVARLLNSLLRNAPTGPEQAQRVNTARLVGDIVRLYSYRLPRTIAITSNIANREVTLPRDTVRQILVNLLKNSHEAIGDQPGDIVVTFKVEDDTATLTVSDTGPGYPEKFLTRGIRAFDSTKTDGTGLGLSVIQRLVASAGGTIELLRARDGGALTAITLPCQQAEASDAVNHPD